MKVQFKSYRTEVVGKLNKGAVKGVTDVSLDILRRSTQRAPIKDGTLRGSSSADINGTEIAKGTPEGGVIANPGAQPPQRDDRVEGIVGFSEKYALRQHEELEYEHPKGGEAKYLEKTFLERQAASEEYIRKAIRESVDE